VAALEVDEVVAPRVEHEAQAGIAHEAAERRQIGEGERIDEPGLPRDVGHLDEGEPFRIMMEAVALGIEGDLGTRAEPLGKSGEIVSGTDPERRDVSRLDSLARIIHERAEHGSNAWRRGQGR